MADENQATTDEAAQTQQQTQTSEPSLEDIAKEFGVEDQANRFTAEPPKTQQTQQVAAAPLQAPDPVTDPEAYRNFMGQQATIAQQVQQGLSTIAERITNFERAQVQQKVNADLKAAVAKVNETLKVDPMMAEIALEKMYRTDASFQKIWDHRDRNPAAFDKALGLIANKLAPMFAVKQDPQLTENRRAAQASTRTNASTAKQDYDPSLKRLYEPDSQADFDMAWERMKRGLAP